MSTLGSVTSCAVNAERRRWNVTDEKKKRRGVSKLRLYKAMKAELKELGFDREHSVDEFMEVLKDEVIDEVSA